MQKNVQCMGQLAKVDLTVFPLYCGFVSTFGFALGLSGDWRSRAFSVHVQAAAEDRENDLAMTMVARDATAALHFRQALERQPCHYEALSQFTECCQRRGSLTEAEPSLRLAEMKAIYGQNDRGTSYFHLRPFPISSNDGMFYKFLQFLGKSNLAQKKKMDFSLLSHQKFRLFNSFFPITII
jgi:hypothetical protein